MILICPVVMCGRAITSNREENEEACCLHTCSAVFQKLKKNLMGQYSKIEWTHHTANLWHGCTKVHEGCNNCYAELIAKNMGSDIWGIDKPRKAIKSVWPELDKMQIIAKNAGEIHRVFVGSMMDIFERTVPVVDAKGEKIYYPNRELATTGHLRNVLFQRISNNRYPNMMFLLLTKRPSNIKKYIPESWKTNPPENVMFGTSPVNQETADKLISQLLEVKGKRFLSVEPQLDRINIQDVLLSGGVDWVIQGGESGPNRRPFNLDWAYDLKQQCEVSNTPYFFKQIDKLQKIPDDLLIREFPVEKGVITAKEEV